MFALMTQHTMSIWQVLIHMYFCHVSNYDVEWDPSAYGHVLFRRIQCSAPTILSHVWQLAVSISVRWTCLYQIDFWATLSLDYNVARLARYRIEIVRFSFSHILKKKTKKKNEKELRIPCHCPTKIAIWTRKIRNNHFTLSAYLGHIARQLGKYVVLSSSTQLNIQRRLALLCCVYCLVCYNDNTNVSWWCLVWTWEIYVSQWKCELDISLYFQCLHLLYIIHCTTLYDGLIRTQQIKQEGWLPPTKRASAAKIN